MYKEFKLDLSHAQATKVLHGKSVRLTAAQLGKGHAHYFHPENHKKLVRAYENHKGTTLHMSHGEVLRTHQSGLSGSGFWGDVWNGIKSGVGKLGSFLKDNWRPILSGVMDVGANIIPEAGPLRGLVKDVSGLGLKQPRRRLAGGSFRLN